MPVQHHLHPTRHHPRARRDVRQEETQPPALQRQRQRPRPIPIAVPTHHHQWHPKLLKLHQRPRLAHIPQMPNLLRAPAHKTLRQPSREPIMSIRKNHNPHNPKANSLHTPVDPICSLTSRNQYDV